MLSFPLFILPFDHRSGFAKELMGTSYPLTEAETLRARELKKIIWQAFLLAQKTAPQNSSLAILIDEELGEEIIIEAKKLEVPVIISVEKSGTETLEFIHGPDFGLALKKLRPSAAKVLVKYKPEEKEKNVDQQQKLLALSDFCQTENIPLVLEILFGQDEPKIVAQTISELEAAHIKPAIWKLEGFAEPSAWQIINAASTAPIVLLGRGESADQVSVWVKAAAQSGLVQGFAIGRTIFLEPLKEYVNGQKNATETEQKIADNFLYFIKLWQDNSQP